MPFLGGRVFGSEVAENKSKTMSVQLAIAVPNKLIHAKIQPKIIDAFQTYPWFHLTV
jgi:hypothetical protein